MIIVIFTLFITGICVGSFLNVLVDRLPRGESIGFWTSQNDKEKRSHCEHCKHTLAWYDLVPLLSFIFLRGKCRYCKVSLSLYYPIIEVITGILFVLAVFLLSHGVILERALRPIGSWDSIASLQNDMAIYIIVISYYLYLVSSLIVIFFVDLKNGIIPDKILVPAIVITFLFQLYAIRYTLYASLLSALGVFLLFLFLHLATRGRGMGFGDVKYVILMGLVLGFPGIVVGMYIAFLTGAAVSLILIAWHKKKLHGSTIPFGPFLVFGTIVAMFWGTVLLRQFLPFLVK